VTMNRIVITDPYDASQWNVESLRLRLAAAAPAAAERLTGFRLERLGADNSKAFRVALDYSPHAAPDWPRSLFLKLCGGGTFGPSEVDYYMKDYVRLEGAPLPRCYDAAYEDGAYHLLLEDLSVTHRNRWDAAPTLLYGQAAGAALAKLHAHHWGAVSEDAADAAVDGMQRYLAYMMQGREPLLEALRDAPDAERRAFAERVFDKLPAALLRRAADAAGCTLVHGDLNPGNILTRGEDDSPDVRFIDRQPFDWSLTHWVGASDLAYLMGLWWEPEQRRAYEIDALRAYYEGLLARGAAADYPWDRLLRDYRLTLLQNVFVAASWCIDERERSGMRWLWEAELDRAAAAYRDWDGAALLDGA